MANRFYTFDGDDRDYVSVTTFLSIISKPFLTNWAAKMERQMIQLLIEQGGPDAEILQRLIEYTTDKAPYGYKYALEVSSDWGKHVHKAIENHLKDKKLPRLSKEERKAFDKWLEWWNGSGYVVMQSEDIVRSTQHGFAGTEDIRMAQGDKVIIGDWKTTNYHYKEHDYQNYAYQMAEWETDRINPDGGLLVYVPKDDHEIVAKPLPKPELAEILIVLNALGLWRAYNNKPWKEENEQPKND